MRDAHDGGTIVIPHTYKLDGEDIKQLIYYQTACIYRAAKQDA